MAPLHRRLPGTLNHRVLLTVLEDGSPSSSEHQQTFGAQASASYGEVSSTNSHRKLHRRVVSLTVGTKDRPFLSLFRPTCQARPLAFLFIKNFLFFSSTKQKNKQKNTKKRETQKKTGKKNKKIKERKKKASKGWLHPKRLKHDFLKEMLQEIVQPLRPKKKKKVKTKKKNLDPKSRTPPFRRLTRLLKQLFDHLASWYLANVPPQIRGRCSSSVS